MRGERERFWRRSEARPRRACPTAVWLIRPGRQSGVCGERAAEPVADQVCSRLCSPPTPLRVQLRDVSDSPGADDAPLTSRTKCRDPEWFCGHGRWSRPHQRVCRARDPRCYLAFLLAASAACFNSLFASSSRFFAFAAWPSISNSLACWAAEMLLKAFSAKRCAAARLG